MSQKTMYADDITVLEMKKECHANWLMGGCRKTCAFYFLRGEGSHCDVEKLMSSFDMVGQLTLTYEQPRETKETPK